MNPAAPLVLSMGEPAGIGGEITVKAWAERRAHELPPFYVIDNPDRLDRIAREVGIGEVVEEVSSPEEASRVFDRALPVLSLGPINEYTPGKPHDGTASDTLKSLGLAFDHVSQGTASGLITNPIHKANLYKVGFEFQGHTDYLTYLAHVTTPPVMMLASDELRVVPVTQHIPVSDVPGALKTEDIIEATTIVNEGLKSQFGIDDPTIAIAGLNPHAGEDGHIGKEEQTIIAPAIAELQMRGIRIIGPMPADTMFHETARKKYDAAICMYHDQALIPIKTIAFDSAVNVTLGLPFVRTSPDHGTALDVAGQGVASPTGMIAAIKMAGKLAAARNKDQA